MHVFIHISLTTYNTFFHENGLLDYLFKCEYSTRSPSIFFYSILIHMQKKNISYYKDTKNVVKSQNHLNLNNV